MMKDENSVNEVIDTVLLTDVSHIKSDKSIGLRTIDVITTPERSCVACKTPTKNMFVVNPFCQTHLAFLCENCERKLENS